MLNRFLSMFILATTLMAAAPSTVFAEAAHDGAEDAGHETPSLNFFDFSAKDSHPLVALLFNFGALVVIVYLLMKKPLGKRFQQRKDALAKALEEAKSAKEKAEAAIETARAKSAAIEDEMARLHDEIIASAEKESAAIVARAEEKAARMVADTESLITHEISMLAQELREEIVQDVINKATEEIRRQITEADHDRLTTEYLSGVKETAETVKQ